MLLTAHESRREILGYQPRFMLPTVAPGQNNGSAPYRQLCPAYPSADRISTDSVAMTALVIGRKAAQERFSEENFRNLTTHLFYITGNGFLNSSTASVRRTLRKLTAHSKLG